MNSYYFLTLFIDEIIYFFISKVWSHKVCCWHNYWDKRTNRKLNALFSIGVLRCLWSVHYLHKNNNHNIFLNCFDWWNILFNWISIICGHNFHFLEQFLKDQGIHRQCAWFSIWILQCFLSVYHHHLNCIKIVLHYFY